MLRGLPEGKQIIVPSLGPFCSLSSSFHMPVIVRASSVNRKALPWVFQAHLRKLAERQKGQDKACSLEGRHGHGSISISSLGLGVPFFCLSLLLTPFPSDLPHC